MKKRQLMNAYKRYKEKQAVEVKEEVEEEEDIEEEEEAVPIEPPPVQSTPSTETWGEWIAKEFWKLLGYSWPGCLNKQTTRKGNTSAGIPTP